MNGTSVVSPPEVDTMLTMRDLMGIFKQSRKTVEKHYLEHGLPYFKVDNGLRFWAADVKRFIEQNTRCQFNPSGCVDCPCRATCCYRSASQN